MTVAPHLALSTRLEGRHMPWACRLLHSLAVASWHHLQSAHAQMLGGVLDYAARFWCCANSTTAGHAQPLHAGAAHSQSGSGCAPKQWPKVAVGLTATLSAQKRPSLKHVSCVLTCSHQPLLSHGAHHACWRHALHVSTDKILLSTTQTRALLLHSVRRL